MMTTQLPNLWHEKDADDLIGETLREWLEHQANLHQLQFLLAHADDGVIWGKFRSGHLITPNSAVPLRLSTLQQCRIFGDRAEVLLWKANGVWKYRTIDDSEVECDYIPETQILWGNKVIDTGEEFTVVEEGSQGFRYAIPFTNLSFESSSHLLRLQVRHYIDYDEDGVARIKSSRLVNVQNQ